MITGFISYVADLLFYFFAIGVGLHLFDRFFGVGFYRWWYNRSRETPLPDAIDMGFMYNRPFSRRHKIALWLSGLQSVYMLWVKGISILTEVIAFPLEAWMILLGFSAGKYVYDFMKGEDKIVEVIKQASIPNLLKRGREYIANVLSSFSRTNKPAVTPPAADERAEAETPKPQEPHWRDRLKSYTKQ